MKEKKRIPEAVWINHSWGEDLMLKQDQFLLCLLINCLMKMEKIRRRNLEFFATVIHGIRYLSVSSLRINIWWNSNDSSFDNATINEASWEHSDRLQWSRSYFSNLNEPAACKFKSERFYDSKALWS